MFAWFAEATIVAAALAALAAIATRGTRLGAAGRHLLWLVVLLKMVSPPLFRWPVQNLSIARFSTAPLRTEAEPMPGAVRTTTPRNRGFRRASARAIRRADLRPGLRAARRAAAA